MSENREVISGQFKNVSAIMEKLGSEIDTNYASFKSLEDKILNELNIKGIKVSGVKIEKNAQGRVAAEISIKNFLENKGAIGKILSVLKSILEADMVLEKPMVDGRTGILKFAERKNFTAEIGYAKNSYDATGSGDNLAFFSHASGKFIVILSDGMGTGRAAAGESRLAVNLLRQMLESGFDKNISIKLINSMVLLKSSKDTFASIDLCIIDEFSGVAEFSKNSASSSFLIRKGRLEEIGAHSLPVGIIPQISPGTIVKTVEDGDVIVILSDGFESKKNKNGWLGDFLTTASQNLTPRAFASQLLSRGIKELGENPHDDMTAIVLKIGRVKEGECRSACVS
jgi:stage II sporulation protein E